MIERVTPEPSPDELTAIRAALSRRLRSAAPAAWTLDARDLEFDDLRAAVRARKQRPS
ncbi:MAG: hypothetical protein M3M96_03555 [Candidatus Eremiobacteraeota bacterium]|nr:hypothetical protein [Candidatus Eremiobacteraeota bacterium]